MQGGGAATDDEGQTREPGEGADEPESAEEQLEEGERPGEPGTEGAGQGSHGGAV
jgi:hypothetical protein